MADLQSLFDLADPRVRRIWNERNTQLSSRLGYQNLGFTDHMAEIKNSVFENFTGLGLAQQTGEKEAYNREDILQASSVTATPVKFTKAIDISEEMLRFNLWPEINNLVSAAANSVNARIDTNVAKMLYLGNGTTFFTGGDSLSLINSAHTQADGSATQSNTFGVTQLTYTNLKLAAQRLDRFYDDKGIQLLPARKLALVVGRENLENAKEILRSIGDPTTANRVSNVFAAGDYIDLVVSNWIPSTTYGFYWFLIDKERAAIMNTKVVWGWKPKFDSDNVINNGTRIYTASTMFVPTTASWQWIYGSQASS